MIDLFIKCYSIWVMGLCAYYGTLFFLNLYLARSCERSYEPVTPANARNTVNQGKNVLPHIRIRRSEIRLQKHRLHGRAELIIAIDDSATVELLKALAN